MNTITLKEASSIAGRDESTIRKFFNKPENKKYRQVVRGKVYIDKDFLLKQYGVKLQSDSDESGNSRHNGKTSDMHPGSQLTIDPAMQALISQLEVKDNQISELLTRMHESNSNHARSLQQNNQSNQYLELKNNPSIQSLLEVVSKKDQEISDLKIKIQETRNLKQTKLDNTLMAAILVLVISLIFTMLN